MMAVATETQLVDLLCFDIGTERFALPLASIEEIVDGVNVERAESRAGAIGVLRVRGAVLPVYDASSVLKARRVSAEPLALILSTGQSDLALLVDAAEASAQINLDALQRPIALVSSDRVMEGVLRVGARWVGVLNFAAFVESLTGAASTGSAKESAQLNRASSSLSSQPGQS